MERSYKSITELPEILEVSDGDKLLAHHNGRAYQADASLFHGNDATINGEPAIEIEAGENITLTQDGTTFTISADGAINTVKVNGTALSIVQKAVDILIGAGTADGTISVNGADVSVTGLAAALTALTTLIGNDANKSARTIALEELTVQLIPEGAKAALDTLQEIAAWIQAHPDDAAAINAKLTLGTHEVDGQQVQYATVKAYVEAMVTGLITLASLSASVSGAGNAITGVSYDNTTGAFAFTKGTTFLTQHQDISGKQDKLPVTGAANKGVYVSAAGVVSPMTYELNKSVPANAVFTDTTYSPAVSGGANGLMTGADKAKLDGISLPAGGISMPVILANQSIANFDSTAAGRPLRVTAHIEPVQSGSGDPSPDNVRPIAGWTNINILRTGKNILDLTTFVQIWGTVSATVSSNKVILTYISGAGQGGPHMLLKAGNYTFQFLSVEHSSSDTVWQISAVEYNTSNSYAWLSSAEYTRGVRHISFTLSEEKDIIILFRMRHSGATLTTSDTMVITNPMLYRGEYDSGVSFEPYSGNNYSVSFETAGTVYGGTLDVARGLLTVTHKMATFDGSEPWVNVGGSYPQAFQVDSSKVSDVKLYPMKTADNILTTSKYLPIWTNSADIGIRFQDNTTRLYVYDSTVSADLPGFLASLSAAPLQVVYRLASPITYQLTPQQIVTLAETNHVFADCGPVTVTHWPGTGTPVEPVDDGAEIAWKKGIIGRIAALEGGS